MEPLVSFILVNWNTCSMTLKCIDSIYSDCEEFQVEVIVVDNASSDGSADAIEREYPFAVVVRNSENLGFARGNNLGIKAAKGEYVCLINTDVIIKKGCTGALLEYLKKHDDVSFIAPQVLNGDGTIQISVRKEVTLFNTFCRVFYIDYLFPGLIRYNHTNTEQVDDVTGCFWLVRKEVIARIGGLDEKFYFYGEDRDFCRRVRMEKFKIIYHPAAQIIHYAGTSSKGNPYRYYLLMEHASLIYWRKHHGKVSFILFKLIRIGFHISRSSANGIAWISSCCKNEESKKKSLRSLYGFLFQIGIKKIGT